MASNTPAVPIAHLLGFADEIADDIERDEIEWARTEARLYKAARAANPVTREEQFLERLRESYLWLCAHNENLTGLINAAAPRMAAYPEFGTSYAATFPGTPEYWAAMDQAQVLYREMKSAPAGPPTLEEVRDQAEAAADAAGVYGCGEFDGENSEEHADDCKCRFCFVEEYVAQRRPPEPASPTPEYSPGELLAIVIDALSKMPADFLDSLRKDPPVTHIEGGVMYTDLEALRLQPEVVATREWAADLPGGSAAPRKTDPDEPPECTSCGRTTYNDDGLCNICKREMGKKGGSQ